MDLSLFTHGEPFKVACMELGADHESGRVLTMESSQGTFKFFLHTVEELKDLSEAIQTAIKAMEQ